MGLLESHECPRCGAPLPKSGGGSVVCKYCRVTVNQQQPPLVVNRHPARQSTGLPDWVKQWVKLETVFAIVAGLGLLFWQFQKHWPSPSVPPILPPELPHTGPTSDPRVPSRHVAAGEPQLRAAFGKLLLISKTAVGNGEQQKIASVARFADRGEQLWLAAWSSEAGRLAWRWPMPAGATDVNTERAVLGDAILVRSAEAIVRLNAETGEVTWTGPAPAARGRLCATKAYVGVKTDESPTRVLNWATGRPFDVKPGACETFYSSEDAGPNFQYLAASTLTDLRKRPKDFQVVRGLLPNQGNARVILGTVTRGAEATPAVSVAANGRWVWQQDVSAYTLAQLPEPALASVRRESVVVPYWDTQNGLLRMSAFHLKSGARLWDTALSEPTTVRSTVDIDVGVTLDGVVVVRLFDGRLRAYSLSDGDLQWSLGG